MQASGLARRFNALPSPRELDEPAFVDGQTIRASHQFGASHAVMSMKQLL
jgi:hypothetical protein